MKRQPVQRRIRRPRVPDFVVEKIGVIDYKNIETLRWFINENGRIKPRRQTGLNASQQRQVAVAVKRARHMALLSFTTADSGD